MEQIQDELPSLAATDCHDSPNPLNALVQDSLVAASCAQAAGFDGFAQALRQVAHDELAAQHSRGLADTNN
ncbi:hypothetical protein [Paracoccus cavernae]